MYALHIQCIYLHLGQGVHGGGHVSVQCLLHAAREVAAQPAAGEPPPVHHHWVSVEVVEAPADDLHGHIRPEGQLRVPPLGRDEVLREDFVALLLLLQHAEGVPQTLGERVDVEIVQSLPHVVDARDVFVNRQLRGRRQNKS